jgi:tetratricopeptide (TPR) repeat protein
MAYINIGNICIKLNDYEKAIANFTMAINLMPNNSSAYYNRGYAYFFTGEYNLAFKDFKKYLTYDPDNETIKQQIEKIHQLSSTVL